MTFMYAHAANFSNIDKCHRNFSKMHIKQNSAYNTRKNLKSWQVNQSAFRPHKQIEYE